MFTQWILDHKPSLLLWDMMDITAPGEIPLAIHKAHWALGIVLVDNCNFSEARPVLAAREQAVAALSVSPLLMPGATGCNVNPMLIL